MSFKNPTYLQIGRTGNYGGITWRVAGRAVLGVREDGEVYYWNEFNLEGGNGETATLVFERTERGSEWRWFSQFEPEYQMTAADAATKVVGDVLNFDGTDVRVTLLEKSRIYFVEGTPPPGEHVGSEANYFNAENGAEMLVISWTGGEVEYYRGRTITNREVREAFQLDQIEHPSVPAGELTRHNRVEPSGYDWWDIWPKLLVGLIITGFVLLIFAPRISHHIARSRQKSGVVRFAAPASPLTLGAAGQLAGIHYQITGHAVLDVAEVNLRFAEQEYFLRNDQNEPALLIAGFVPGGKDWYLFTPTRPDHHFTPFKAGAIKLGHVVAVDGMAAPVSELFTTTVRDAQFTGTPEIIIGDSFYGFAGKHDAQVLLATWDIDTITFWRGQNVSSQSVLTALGPATVR